MRTLAVFLFLTLPGLADVAVLKDGRKVSGKVVEKPTHFEVITDGGLRTFLKEEVERIVTNPKEILGDADKLYEEAKQEYQKAKTIDAADARNATLREAIGKLKSARDSFTSAREVFPEEKYADLDQKLVLVMQLTRMLRGEMTHEGALVREDSDHRTLVETRPLPSDLGSAFATLADPVKRSSAELRAAARETFRLQRVHYPGIYEVATAAMLFLSRSDSDWKLQGPVQQALQEYFAKPWIAEPLKMSPADHAAAAQYLTDRISALRKADPRVSTEALALFGIGHVGHAPIGEETDRTARLLGLMVQNGIAGTPEGHVVRDLNGWISGGDYDLAVLCWVREHRAIDTPIVRFVWATALIRLAQQKKRGYERGIAALGAIPASDAAVRDHFAALARSVKAVAICGVCGGEGKLRCTNCHGKKETKVVCRDCGGTGKKKQSSGFLLDNCPRCKSTGIENLIKCEKCKDGFNECKQCDRKPHAAPELDEMFTTSPCPDCDGRGYVFRKILWACKSCMGVGQRLVPKADPAKVLPSDRP
jgi:hypothetical protein